MTRTRSTPAPGEGHEAQPDEEQILDQIRAAIRSIEFGSVLLKIHQGEVVGIETSTKVRLRNT